MSNEKHSRSHTAVHDLRTERKNRRVGEHTAYRAPAFRFSELKKQYKPDRKLIFIICAALAAVLVILCSVLIIHSNKKDYDSYITKAAEYYGNEDYDNALTMLRKASESGGDEQKEECLLFMADCYEAQGNIDKAIEALKKADSRVPATARRIAQLQQNKIEMMESDKLQIAGEKFTESDRNIKLEGRGLKDGDIKDIGKFINPEKLSLANNEIQDISVCSGFKSLVNLNLSDNRISDISPLTELTGLKYLNLDNNPVSGLRPLLELKSLSFLSIKGINIKPEQLQKLSEGLPTCSIYSDAQQGSGFTISIGGKSFSSEVQVLDLSGMGLTDISAIAQCRNLSQLDISDNKLSDLYAVMNLPELKTLDISNNMIGDMRPLMGLKNLDTVLASGNRIAATAAFGSMDSLKTLNLSDNPIGDFSGFEDMDMIESLSLNNTGLNDEGLGYLDKLYTLRKLEISDNPQLSGEAVDALKSSLGGCRVSHSKLYYMVEFGDVKVRADVKELDLSSRGLSNISPISNMCMLESLNLSSNNISNLYFFQYTQSMDTIKKLDLSSNNITDISFLCSLSNLEELNLARNQLSSVGKLANLKNLKYLDLSGNPLEKEDVDQLKKDMGGCKIKFE